MPDLAASVPAPTDGGRTYAFRLRRGLRYSTGAAVHASDIRRGLERVLRVNAETASFYTSIRGARRCLERRSEGAVRSLLRHPGRRRRGHDHLPSDGSRPGLPLQAGAAQRRRGGSRGGHRRRAPGPRHRPVHGRRARRPHEPLRLVRNPRFRPVDGRPDGYPDAITIDCCADPQRAFARRGARARGPRRRRPGAHHRAGRPGRRACDALRRTAPRNADPRHDLRFPEHPHAAVRRRQRAPRAELRCRSPRGRCGSGRRARRAGHVPVPARRTSRATEHIARIRRAPVATGRGALPISPAPGA